MTTTNSWSDLIEAARRKVSIAQFHLDGLRKLPSDVWSVRGTAPEIPVQAHFEGVIVSVIAAIDQVAQAINSELNLGLSPNQLVQQAYEQVGSRVPSVRTWFADPFGRDLRRIRTRMAHYSYRKAPIGPLWTVESSGVDYSGSRDLTEYAQAAVDYGQRLLEIVPDVEATLPRH